MRDFLIFRPSRGRLPRLKFSLVALVLLIAAFCFTLSAPLVALGQLYPPLPVPQKYQGRSGERGQIMLDGIVKSISAYHGEVDDEADWHVSISLPTNVTLDLQSGLLSTYSSIDRGDCNRSESCNLATIYSELMVCDRHKSTTLDEYFYSGDFTLPYLLSQPPAERRPVLAFNFDGTPILDPDWTGEHPAWDLGLITQNSQAKDHDFTKYSNLDGGRAYLQGAFVEDAEHRRCRPTPGIVCYLAPPKFATVARFEIHPLDSIAFAMNETGKVLSAKWGDPGWPFDFVKWRVAVFADSKYHRINGEAYVKKIRTTTWYLDLPVDAQSTWGDLATTIRVIEQRRTLWNGGNKTWYGSRGVNSYVPWTLAVDPKDGLKKLKIVVKMDIPDNWGGIVVRDYGIRVTLHSNPDLGIRVSKSNFEDAQFQKGVVARQAVPPATTAVYFVRGKNQGPLQIRFKFQGLASSPNWNVKYFDPDGADITTEMTSNRGWLSPLINGGISTREIRVEVTPSAAFKANGAEKLVRISAQSSLELDRIDVVSALTKVGLSSGNPVVR
jgi:hypothetical protein